LVLAGSLLFSVVVLDDWLGGVTRAVYAVTCVEGMVVCGRGT